MPNEEDVFHAFALANVQASMAITSQLLELISTLETDEHEEGHNYDVEAIVRDVQDRIRKEQEEIMKKYLEGDEEKIGDQINEEEPE